MRVGQNPVKGIEKIAPPAPVTVIVISFIPFLSGYYEQSLEILKLCLQSIRANTEGEYDLMVFDNGNCEEVRGFLLGEQRNKKIDYLFLSQRNLGKPAAWNAALAAAPGEFIAYADSDVYFMPGWLPASLAALRAFPKAGMVTAMPMLIPEKYSTTTIKWAQRQRGVKVERGALLPWEDFWRHARSLGDSEGRAREFYEQNESVRLIVRGKKYFVGAAHFQFTARKEALQAVLPIPADRPMGKVRLLDEAMNKAGYLRLCTDQQYVQHLGNTLTASAGEDSFAPDRHRRGRRKVWQWSPLRKALQWLYGWSFNRLYRDK